MKKQKTKLGKLNKTIIAVETLFVIGVLLYLFFNNSPQQFTPLSGSVIYENFSFEFENGKIIEISAGREFTNPIELSEESEINLPSGTYYWRVKGFLRNSEIRNFTIPSTVVLNMKEKNESYVIENAGNIDLNVTKKNKSGITGQLVLKIGESWDIEKENNTIIEGRQK